MTSVNLYVELENQGNHKLLQLGPDLLNAIREGNVMFKSADERSDVVICSKEKTWILKQKNHSNTVLLMKEFVPEEIVSDDKIAAFGLPFPRKNWLGFSKQAFELEPRLIKGQVDISALPIYHGEVDFPVDQRGEYISVEQFKNRSPCSEHEFHLNWYRVAGCNVNGIACVLADSLVSRALHIILISILAESLDIENLNVENVYESIAKDIGEGCTFNPYSYEVLNTVLNKFCSSSREGVFNLDLTLIAQWYGTDALRKFAYEEPIGENEFMIKWKSLFPPFFQCDIDLELLRGLFARPLLGKVQYLSRNTLPTDAKDRFKQLFKVQSTWELQDIAPFIEDLNTKGTNLESFVMKFARRRKVGKAILVTSR